MALAQDRTVPLLIIISFGSVLGLLLAEPATGSMPEVLKDTVAIHPFLDGKRIPIADASPASLRQIPGVTRRAAKALAELRKSHGPICSWDVFHTIKMKGVGQKTLEKFRANVLLDEACAFK
jgi:hypothetical protein